MVVQDEVTWVLETIKTNWPGDWPADQDGTERLYRVNRDEPEVLETGQREKSVEMTRASALGASLGSRTPEATGTEYDHSVTTTIDCRLKGLTSQGGEHGHIDSATGAKRVVFYALHALEQERSYPEVDPDAEEIGRVDYHTLLIDEPTDRSREFMDGYFWTWSVRLVGYEDLP